MNCINCGHKWILCTDVQNKFYWWTHINKFQSIITVFRFCADRWIWTEKNGWFAWNSSFRWSACIELFEEKNSQWTYMQNASQLLYEQKNCTKKYAQNFQLLSHISMKFARILVRLSFILTIWFMVHMNACDFYADSRLELMHICWADTQSPNHSCYFHNDDIDTMKSSVRVCVYIWCGWSETNRLSCYDFKTYKLW